MFLLEAGITKEDIEHITTLSEAINNYGTGSVILAVFIVITLCLILYMTITNKKYIDDTRKQNNRLLDEIMHGKKKYDEKDIVEIFVKLNEILKRECHNTLKKVDASGISIYVFHNGKVTSHGLPFFKMSCISEWIGKGSGIDSRLETHANMSLNISGNVVESLYNNGEYILTTERDMDDETALKTFMSGRTTNTIFYPIYDSNDRIMGFIQADFIEEIYFNTDRIASIKRRLCDLAMTVRPVLEFSDFRSCH